MTIATKHMKSRPYNQRDYCYLAHEILAASKAAFLENFLAVSAWILNESPIECHGEETGRFKFLGENLLGVREVENTFQTLRPRKRGFLHETGFSLPHRYHFDGNRKSLDFDYLKSRQFAAIYIHNFLK